MAVPVAAGFVSATIWSASAHRSCTGCKCRGLQLSQIPGNDLASSMISHQFRLEQSLCDSSSLDRVTQGVQNRHARRCTGERLWNVCQVIVRVVGGVGVGEFERNGWHKK